MTVVIGGPPVVRLPSGIMPRHPYINSDDDNDDLCTAAAVNCSRLGSGRPDAHEGLLWTVSMTGGYEPRWRADGREMYYLSLDQKLMAVGVGPGPSFGAPKELFRCVSPAA
jgi:hypothetical protein